MVSTTTIVQRLIKTKHSLFSITTKKDSTGELINLYNLNFRAKINLFQF